MLTNIIYTYIHAMDAHNYINNIKYASNTKSAMKGDSILNYYNCKKVIKTNYKTSLKQNINFLL